MVMVLSREDAIDSWRTIMGPTDPEVAKEQAPESLRALLGKDVLQNAIHGSSTPQSAKQKIAAIFPEVEIKEDGNLIGEYHRGSSWVLYFFTLKKSAIFIQIVKYIDVCKSVINFDRLHIMS